MSKFEELEKFDCSKKVEKRSDGTNNLSYLSWTWAWSFFKKHYPDATYEIKHFFNDESKMLLPYMYDKNTGYMVMTSIKAGDLTYEMWLPVMDNKNKAMKSEPYEYSTKYGKKSVEAATMFDVNKTIMRCLVKNMAMFGLGLYIYAGEDLPESQPGETEKTKTAVDKLFPSENQETTTNIDADFDLLEELKNKKDISNLIKFFNENQKNAKNKAEFLKEFQNCRKKLQKGA